MPIKDSAPRRRGAIPALCAAAAALLAGIPALAEAADNVTTPLEAFFQTNYVESVVIVPALTLLALLGFIVYIDPYIRADRKRTMMDILAVVFGLVAQNLIENRLATGAGQWLFRTIIAILGYILRPLLLVEFLRLIQSEKRMKWAWALIGVNAAINSTALFSHICFWIDAENHYQGGPLSSTCLVVSAILLAYLFYRTFRVFHPNQRKETWAPVFVLILIVVGVTMDYFIDLDSQPLAYLTIAVVLSCVVYYIWLHLQFVREHEQALVAGQRIQLTLSQIRPHFLFNSLGAIEELCDSDPAMAKTATAMFSQYLRGNMDSLTQEEGIPFAQELEHTRLYLKLEQLRFEDSLQVSYDIACTDFTIPPLTLEPLAENAVRHGVRGNEDGRGTVTIASRAYPDRYEVSVRDDGPGFDPEAPLPEDRPHVGIQNVRERLHYMCGGRLRVDSAPGRGTTATIILPREAEKKP